ncbi:hypothetical protein O204_22490 [Pseudomonas simiae]|uniref:Uncharacterized protein n=1 Tax=Pseudomonas simiae TaxID=321846 RepID=U1UTY8_9PSED|nr:hypothetical protein O204_22490 [Pseudomonas simiae]
MARWAASKEIEFAALYTEIRKNSACGYVSNIGLIKLNFRMVQFVSLLRFWGYFNGAQNIIPCLF